MGQIQNKDVPIEAEVCVCEKERVIWKCYTASDFENGGRRSQAKQRTRNVACL